MRCLASIHVFRLTGPERFANNRISAQLVHNEHMRAYITMLQVNSLARVCSLLLIAADRKFLAKGISTLQQKDFQNTYWGSRVPPTA
jgi:hypothetical protein